MAGPVEVRALAPAAEDRGLEAPVVLGELAERIRG